MLFVHTLHSPSVLFLRFVFPSFQVFILFMDAAPLFLIVGDECRRWCRVMPKQSRVRRLHPAPTTIDKIPTVAFGKSYEISVRCRVVEFIDVNLANIEIMDDFVVSRKSLRLRRAID